MNNQLQNLKQMYAFTSVREFAGDELSKIRISNEKWEIKILGSIHTDDGNHYVAECSRCGSVYHARSHRITGLGTECTLCSCRKTEIVAVGRLVNTTNKKACLVLVSSIKEPAQSLRAICDGTDYNYDKIVWSVQTLDQSLLADVIKFIKNDFCTNSQYALSVVEHPNAKFSWFKDIDGRELREKLDMKFQNLTNRPVLDSFYV